jgi:hypothetical protein
MAQNDKDHDRAPLSSVFAFIAAAALLAFIYGVTQTITGFQHWSFQLILWWGGALAVALILWAWRAFPPRAHLIGNPTLSMVGGVAGGVIAAVALAFSLNSAIDQEKSLHVQSALMQQQADTLKRIEAELIQMRTVRTATPAPETTVPAVVK